jgi:hypothetical protein
MLVQLETLASKSQEDVSQAEQPYHQAGTHGQNGDQSTGTPDVVSIGQRRDTYVDTSDRHQDKNHTYGYVLGPP